MGVDVRITLPDDVRVRDVADVIGALAGLPKEKRHFGSGDGWSVNVRGVEVVGFPSIPSLCAIHLNGEMVDGEKAHNASYHFEWSEGGRGLMPRSTPFWCAVAVGLVNFFGGRVDFNDCDDSEVDYEAPRRRANNAPGDGEEWTRFQEEKMAVEPIRELRRDVAAYD